METTHPQLRDSHHFEEVLGDIMLGRLALSTLAEPFLEYDVTVKKIAGDSEQSLQLIRTSHTLQCIMVFLQKGGKYQTLTQ